MNWRLLLVTVVLVSSILLIPTSLTEAKTVDTPTTQSSTPYPVPGGALFVSPTGNDSATGTESDPLLTLTQALRKIRTGGTIVLRGGTYREGVNSINKPVTIQPYLDEQVWIKGSDVLSSWTQQENVWKASDWTSPFCQTCYAAAAIDPAHPLAGKPDQVFINDVPQVQVASLAEVTTGTFFIDPTALTLFIGTNPTNAIVEVSTRWKALQLNAGAEGSIIRGLGFSEFAPHWNEDQLGMVIVNATNVTLDNNIFTRSAGTAVMLARGNAHITNNTIIENGYRGMSANRADNSVVSGNRFDNNNTEHFAVSNCGSVCTVAGFKAAHTKKLQISNNSFSGNDGSGFWCDLGCTDATITSNIINSNTNNGLFYEVSSHATIQGNTITHNGRGIKIAGSDNVTIENNMIAFNTTQLGVYDDARNPATSDTYSSTLGLSWNTTSTIVSNNRFDGSSVTTLLLDSNRTSQINSTQMFGQAQNNTIYGNQKFIWCPSSCTSYTSLARFSTASGLSFGTVASDR